MFENKTHNKFKEKKLHEQIIFFQYENNIIHKTKR